MSSGSFEETIVQRLSDVEARMTSVETDVKELRTEMDGLPEKFAEIVDERNLFYVRSAGRKVLITLGTLGVGGLGAVIGEIVKAFV